MPLGGGRSRRIMGSPGSPGLCDAECGLRLLRDRGKRRSVMDRDVRQNLAVDLHTRLAQTVDDPSVGQAVETRCRVDARNPERAELALLLAPVAVGILPRLDDGLLRRAIDLAPGVVIALRLAENFLVTAPGRHATLDSCHVLSPCPGLLVVRQQLLEATGVGLVHEAGSARAGMALDLAVLVAEVVAAFGRVPLEALRRLAKALGRGPVGFQLGHRLKLLNFVAIAPVARRPWTLVHRRPLRANDPR